jgi:hypothetical protein
MKVFQYEGDFLATGHISERYALNEVQGGKRGFDYDILPRHVEGHWHSNASTTTISQTSQCGHGGLIAEANCKGDALCPQF